MREAVLWSGHVERAWGLKTQFVDAGYGCKEARTGSLRPVPPGKTRMELYCGKCKAERCLWGGLSPRERRAVLAEGITQLEAVRERLYSGAQLEGEAARRKQTAARCRRERKNTSGKPLKESCWNCREIRQMGWGLFVCGLRPEEEPASMRAMNTRAVRKTGCGEFGWRVEMGVLVLERGRRET